MDEGATPGSNDNLDPWKDVNLNVFVGSEIGFLKGVCIGKEVPVLKELSENKEKEEQFGIQSLRWGDDERRDLLLGLVNKTVKVYNTKLKAFTAETTLTGFDCRPGDEKSPLVAVSRVEDKYLVGLDNGTVSLCDPNDGRKPILSFPSGDSLSCIKTCPSDPSLFVTGGKENDLKIWKLGGERPMLLFKAKNVPHVYELRVPVWVQDATFLPQTTDLVAIASRHGHLRLYDSRVDNRNRPVVNMEFCDHPLMSIAPTRNDRQVIVGSAKGRVGLMDIRNYGKERLVHLFHGFNGSVRSIVADENSPYFASCSLDRYLYIHNVNAKAPVKKLYLKSRLTSVAITKNFLAELLTSNPEDPTITTEEKCGSSSDVQTAWHHIDMDVIPGPSKSKNDVPLQCLPAKKSRRSKPT